MLFACPAALAEVQHTVTHSGNWELMTFLAVIGRKGAQSFGLQASAEQALFIQSV